METRANYVLIGLFTLAGLIGILGFFLWFANIQLDRQFAYYDIDFPSVSGLSDASDVRFAGLPVGQVVDVGLSPDGNGLVRVRVEIDAETPVRTDSLATIEAQGVTGVSFVGITAGTPEAPLLATASSEEVPKIEAGQSVLQSLSQDAPEILQETLAVVRDLRQLIGGENQERVATILENVENSSESFSQALDDFSAVSGTVSTFAEEIDQFNATLDALTEDASGMLSAAETTLASVEAFSEEARQLLAQGSEAIDKANTTMSTADEYIASNLSPATEQLQRSAAEIEAQVAAFAENAEDLIATYSETGRAATARLSEAKQTLSATDALIASIETTLESVDAAARRLDGLIMESAEPLITELRLATNEATSVIRLIGDNAETDLPAIFSDIRAATAQTTEIVSAVGQDLSSASGRLDDLARNAGETLDSAREAFSNANETFAAINGVLETSDKALSAAEAAFSGADRIVNEDVADITRRLRDTLDSLETAVGAVADEIPSVTEDLRAASRSAEEAFAQIEGAVDQSAPAFRTFASTALPQYGRLAIETRELVDNLDELIEQIRRDPGRFFLDPRAPEFRR